MFRCQVKTLRQQILAIHTKKKPLDSTWDINKLIDLTEGYTGADLEALVNAAAMAAIKDHIFLKEKSRKLDDANETLKELTIIRKIVT